MPLFVPQSVLSEYERQIANMTDAIEARDRKLAEDQEAFRDMDRVRANLEREISQAKSTVITRERELTERRHAIEHLEEQLFSVRQTLMEVQEKAATIQRQNLAMLSLPLWTRDGKTFRRITPDESPITASDPIIHQISHSVAVALADELRRRAEHGETGAQLLVARTLPLEIEHRPELDGPEL